MKVGLVKHSLLKACEPTYHWIMDSGATCHICSTKEQCDTYLPLQKSLQVTLGDGHQVEALDSSEAYHAVSPRNLSVRSALHKGRIKCCYWLL